MNSPDLRHADPSYRIGAVSRLTGVAPDTLRVWERRYGAVVPLRSEKGSRLYSQNDVGRLALIKSLVDAGDAISRVANLDTAELAERAKGAPLPKFGVEQDAACRAARVPSVGDRPGACSVGGSPRSRYGFRRH